MTRTAAREIAIQLGFGLSSEKEMTEEALERFFEEEHYATLASECELYSVYPDKKSRDYIKTLVLGVSEKREELDGYISRYAKNWKIGRISKTALAVMRVALFEILYMEDVPAGTAINEAVELDKGYDEPETVAFINGILGAFAKAQTEEPKAEEETVGAGE